jgi:dienelactone hydrolase
MTIRTLVLQLLGESPLPVPPNLALRSESAFSGGRRLRVDYAVSEDERVPAYLLVPATGAPPYPGVLALHQHAGEFWLGKSEPAGLSADSMYHYGLELCRRGYVVLCPDMLGFEDRRPPEYRRAEGTAPDGAMYERYVATRLLLEGSSLKAKYTFDLVRALDVLAGLEVVDPERLGVIGHSLGAQEAFWLTWYDARVRVGVASCGLGTLKTILRDQVNHNLAMYLPGLLRVADIDTLVADLAPCPFMLTAGEDDGLFPIDGVRDIVAAARASYAQAGVPDQFRALIFPGGHGFPPTVREEAYRFLDRWLKAGEQVQAGCRSSGQDAAVA